MFQLRVLFVLKERIGVGKISATRFLTIDESARRNVVCRKTPRHDLRRQEFRDGRKHDDDLAAWLTSKAVGGDRRHRLGASRACHAGRTLTAQLRSCTSFPRAGFCARSGRPLRFVLLREAFQDLNAELFCGRPLEPPELVPEPDHFALLFDGHESPPCGRSRGGALEQRGNKESSPPWRDFPGHVALNLFRAARTHESWGFQRPVIWQRRGERTYSVTRGAVAFWIFNFKFELRLTARR
ncbi:hypothetical protein C7U92_15525 [Bradyrhizobium sp. WBOS7]|uniref:Uncharacterized protein n=1 Tax=Bradyrhizobium betae TaxID=244734 RepID=A0AAE9SVR3_9BRAD|nr:hypothetical protein [Bradyrhizobium sp. WBOS2]MDD1572230.1 hypothetical protein [Bradyrhizobium sp. WBOS1]MDD1578132.1 hypothetical protein [Bradyrhizobium sp. WBOS7]MDD1601490.1 hypothetical protein [Bradyrhizobium sp. WBOS16]UUO36977.1 hypothetical protein DCK84_21985 [Bradyrhizobium sp. WBOS01]UUO43280.1 hypothetical protein DCM75_22740 [Bradyrhizobium sp. WBOS02]UUO53214.1 hypothetical protein DCM79_09635 [Bradyrhizobium sp. WBOS07]UUO67216.1 hypothetical protein DCM83_19745 [Bradyrh